MKMEIHTAKTHISTEYNIVNITKGKTVEKIQMIKRNCSTAGLE